MMQDDPAIPFPEICHVREGSPADLAGVQIGDRIIQVNEASAFNTNINVLRTYFETSSKNPLTILLMRGEENLMLKIEMKSVL
jgi:C-terminal processing protease CtpA/Prc